MFYIHALYYCRLLEILSLLKNEYKELYIESLSNQIKIIILIMIFEFYYEKHERNEEIIIKNFNFNTFFGAGVSEVIIL